MIQWWVRSSIPFWFILSHLVGQNVWSQSIDLVELAQSVAEYESLFLEGTDEGSLTDELWRLIPILPESLTKRIIESESVLTNESVRNMVLSWWRSQDPLPASIVNERIVEHVRRIQYALEHYACSTCLTGYDTRGEIYVRYGAPERSTRIVFDDPLLIDAVYQPGVAVSPEDFPDNEFWRYLNLDRDAYFLFIRDGTSYRTGTSADLLPHGLRAGLGQGGRGQVKSKMVLAVMRSIYRQLALEHQFFGTRFSDLDQWLSANEETGRLQSRDPIENAKIITGAGNLTQGERSQPSDLGRNMGQTASTFAQGMILNARSEDQQATYQREILLPPSTSDVLQTLPTFPLAIRHARFLKPDGTTTTEIYWHPEFGRFYVSEDHSAMGYIIQIYSAQETGNHVPIQSNTDAIRVQTPSGIQEVTIPVQTIRMHRSVGMYHIALQWNQYEVIPDSIGKQLGVASRRIDSLYALDASGLELEMSDLKPLVYTGTDEPFPWPHMWIQKKTRFGLAFEIYHLTFGLDDRTRYTVTYEISAKRGRTSSTSVGLEGQSRTEREEILLDLNQYTGEILVTITVQDQISRSMSSRSLILRVHDESG